jgi:hypothetical protein
MALFLVVSSLALCIAGGGGKLSTPIIDCGGALPCPADTVFVGNILFRVHLPDSFIRSLGDNQHGVAVWVSEDTSLTPGHGVGMSMNPWGALQLNQSSYYKVIATCLDGYYQNSDVLTVRYTRQFLRPSISPAACDFADSIRVTMGGEVDVQIRYTLDGSMPDSNAPVSVAPIWLRTSATVTAIAFGRGGQSQPTTVLYNRRQ